MWLKLFKLSDGIFVFQTFRAILCKTVLSRYILVKSRKFNNGPIFMYLPKFLYIQYKYDKIEILYYAYLAFLSFYKYITTYIMMSMYVIFARKIFRIYVYTCTCRVCGIEHLRLSRVRCGEYTLYIYRCTHFMCACRIYYIAYLYMSYRYYIYINRPVSYIYTVHIIYIMSNIPKTYVQVHTTYDVRKYSKISKKKKKIQKKRLPDIFYIPPK